MKKRLVYCVASAAALVVFGGCSSVDGVAKVVGAANNYNPDEKSKEAINAYGDVRKVVREVQDSKKSDAQ